MAVEKPPQALVSVAPKSGRTAGAELLASALCLPAFLYHRHLATLERAKIIPRAQ